MAIKNRYEFMYFVECRDGNPNGDPDLDNFPRIDNVNGRPYGIISDAATKRRIRNFVQLAYGDQPGMNIIIQQGTNINRFIAEAKRAAGVKDAATDKESIKAGRAKACETFFDVRTFGAVMSTGPNAGQVRGPVQVTFGRSIDPVAPVTMNMTRAGKADGITNGTLEDYIEKENETAESSLRTFARKHFVPFGLYKVTGFISANLAEETGFDDEDLGILFEAIMNMYEHDRTASKGHMAVVSPLIIFKHVGTDSNLEQRERQAKLGCAPAHKLFELVAVERKPDVETAQSYKDYLAQVNISDVPAGVEVGFHDGANITWGKLPAGEKWFKAW